SQPRRGSSCSTTRAPASTRCRSPSRVVTTCSSGESAAIPRTSAASICGWSATTSARAPRRTPSRSPSSCTSAAWSGARPPSSRELAAGRLALALDAGGDLGPLRDVELPEDPGEVALDRLLAQVELGRDLLVGAALGDQFRDLALATAERIDADADLVTAALRAGGALAERT